MTLSLLRPLIALNSPQGRDAKLSVLIFHRVLRQSDPLVPGLIDAARFDVICGWLRSWFKVQPLDQALVQLRAGHLPERAAAITFDDGYADNHDVALPILQRHGLTASFFVASSFLNGGRMWNDTLIESIRGARAEVLDLDGIPGIPAARMALGTLAQRRLAVSRVLSIVKYLSPCQRDQAVALIAARTGAASDSTLMMTSDQLRAMRRAGMQIGAHTATHPILAGLDAAAARQEIESGKRALEAMLDERVSLFAYPNGQPGSDYTEESVSLVRQSGFDAAVNTAPGAARMDSDPFQIPRYTPWEFSKLRFGLGLLRNLRRR